MIPAAVLLSAVVAFGASVATAAEVGDPQTYRVEPNRTSVGFTLTNFGVAKEHWRFDRAWGKIVLDPAGEGGTVDFILDSASINSGWKTRDKFLRGEEMFDAENFPSCRFRSRHLEYGASVLVGVDGDLTMRGVTLPMHLDVRRMRCDARPVDGAVGCRAEVVGRISRAAYGMSFGYPVIGDDVEIDLAVTAVRVRDQGETETP
jgi:polyisoprenoid-binding protein YceI